MYNDYYLQSIDNKMSVAIEDIASIEQAQQQLLAYMESGEIYHERITETELNIYRCMGMTVLVVTLIMLMNFITRCLK